MTTQKISMTAVIQQGIDALIFSNANWKSTADSGDSGNWKAEDEDYYIQSQQAVEVLKALQSDIENSVIPTNQQCNVLMGYLAYQLTNKVFFTSMAELEAATEKWYPPVSKIIPVYSLHN